MFPRDLSYARDARRINDSTPHKCPDWKQAVAQANLTILSSWHLVALKIHHKKEKKEGKKFITMFGAVRQNYAWNHKKSLPFTSPPPAVCLWEIKIGRAWWVKRERERLFVWDYSAIPQRLPLSNLPIPTLWARPNKAMQHLHGGCRVYVHGRGCVFARRVCMCVWGRWFLFWTICFEICAVGRVY